MHQRRLLSFSRAGYKAVENGSVSGSGNSLGLIGSWIDVFKSGGFRANTGANTVSVVGKSLNSSLTSPDSSLLGAPHSLIRIRH